MNLYEYAFAALAGGRLDMDRYRSRPVLLVNTASECGYTPQYGQMQSLYNEYRHSGLVVIGMPCNDFGSQEPGEAADILKFVTEQYGVSFPMTAKYSVIGANAHPLFKNMAEKYGSDILPRWNFFKYLFDGRGELVDYWPSQTVPDDPAITHQISRNLQSWSL